MRFVGSTLRDMRRHALSESPLEACGLLAGNDDKYENETPPPGHDPRPTDSRQARRYYPVKNIAKDPRTAFFMDPEDQLRQLRRLAKDGFELCGVFHSHAGSDLLPSSEDIIEAKVDEPNVIMAVEVEAMRAFRVDADGGLFPVEMNGRMIMQVGVPAQGFVPNPNSLMLWKAFVFDDNAEEKMVTYNSLTTRPEDVPDRCICILQMIDSGTVERVFAEYTVLSHEGRWKGADVFDIQAEIDLGTPYAAITRGHWVDTPRFRRMVQVIVRDADFPQPDTRVDDVIKDGIV